MRLLLLLAVLLMPIPKAAAYWLEIRQNEGGFAYDMNMDSDTILSGGHHRTWVRKYTATTITFILVELSCSGEFRMLERDGHDGKAWSRSKEISDWEYILPETKEAYMEERICKK